MRVLLLAPLLLAAACSVPVNTPDSPQITDGNAATPAGVGTPADGDDPATTREALTAGTWTWVRTDEPATGETMAPTEGAAEHVFTFMEDGRFVEDQLGGCCREEGDWTLEGDTLALAYDNGGSATWTDVAATDDELRWTQFSRHGALNNVYRRR